MTTRLFKFKDVSASVAVILVLLLGGCGEEKPMDDIVYHGSLPPKGDRAEENKEDTESSPVVATVANLRIRLGDVLALTKDSESRLRIPPTGGDMDSARKKLRMETLRRMVDRRLLLLGSAGHPEWVSDASWENEVQRLLVSLGPGEVERRRKLAGVSKQQFQDDFRKFVREEMMIDAILEREVESMIEVSEEEKKRRFERDREKTFRRPASWAAYHIDLYLPREKEEELPRLREELEKIRGEVAQAVGSATAPAEMAKRMAPFVEIHSQAKDAQTGYAYIYDTPEVQFDQELVKRVKEATVGELTPVFDLAGDEERVGVSFALVFDKKPGVYASYEEVKKVIEKDIRDEESTALRADLFSRLEKEFPVEIFEEALYSDLAEPKI